MTTLGDYLRDQGFKVNETSVPLSRDAPWDKVRWLFVHHTADSCDPKQAAARASYIKTASGRYPPLAQLMLGRDQVVYVCCKPRSGDHEPGRASHAGEGSYPGIDRDQGNEVSLGVEVQCSGAHPIGHHADSYQTLITLLAALCRRYGLDSTKVIGHKEYSSTGKIDPRDSMPNIRADVAQALTGDDGEMKHTISVTDLDQPLVVEAQGVGFVDFRDVDEDDENLYGDLSIIPDRYIDIDTSGWLHIVGPCQVRVSRWNEAGSDYEASYSIQDVRAPGGYVSFQGSGGLKEGKRLRIQVNAGEGQVIVDDGRWITRYRDHIS